MDITFENHPTMLVITPALGITAGECDDGQCGHRHWRLHFSWFFWTVEAVW